MKISPRNSQVRIIDDTPREATRPTTSFGLGRRALGGALVVWLLLLAIDIHATTFYVDEGLGNNSYDGLSNVLVSGHGPKLNVSSAITAAPDGSTIVVDSGYYSESYWDLGTRSLTLNPQDGASICDVDLCGGDSVGDGIPDWWRLEYFGTPASTNATTCALCDGDHDGINNLCEYRAGTDPADVTSPLPAASCFTNLYSVLGTNFLYVLPPSSQGIFYQGEAVTISNRIASVIEVYDYHSNPKASGASPLVLTGLGSGHYWVQCVGVSGGPGDRTQFTVLPAAYSNSLNTYLGEQPVFWPAWDGLWPLGSNRISRVKPGWVRLQAFWGVACGSCPPGKVCGLQSDDGEYHWDVSDEVLTNHLNGALGVPLRLFNVIADHATNSGCCLPVVETTNTLASWINDVSLLYSNAAVRYGTNFVYEILNEPYYGDVVFDGINSSLAAAMAVSSSVQAVKSVCPACQVWAPSALGIDQGNSDILTNATYIPYYTNANAITWHNGTGYSGPADRDIGYPLWGNSTQYNAYAEAKAVANSYPGKTLAVTEIYPYSPDPLGRANSWWLMFGEWWNVAPPTLTPYNLANRYWKTLIQWRAAGAKYVLHWLALSNGGDIQFTLDQTAYAGWWGHAETESVKGGGPNPPVDGQMLLNYWLDGSTYVTNWVSGNLHCFEWQFADGGTNTIVWSDEGTTVANSLGVPVTDIYSQQWSSAINEEPVIAWGWPHP